MYSDNFLVTNLEQKICNLFFEVQFFWYKIECSKLGARLTEGLVLQ